MLTPSFSRCSQVSSEPASYVDMLAGRHGVSHHVASSHADSNVEGGLLTEPGNRFRSKPLCSPPLHPVHYEEGRALADYFLTAKRLGDLPMDLLPFSQ
jgi:hypothetical protein